MPVVDAGVEHGDHNVAASVVVCHALVAPILWRYH
jgi:hypothetical protein